MNKKQSSKIWLVDLVVVILFILTFTPIVIPSSQIQPGLGSVPYSMWLGFVISILFVFLAFLATIWVRNNTDD